MFGWIVGSLVGTLVAALAFAGIRMDDTAVREHMERWDQSIVVRICADGTRVHRMKNGEFRTNRHFELVESADTVCGR